MRNVVAMMSHIDKTMTWSVFVTLLVNNRTMLQNPVAHNIQESLLLTNTLALMSTLILSFFSALVLAFVSASWRNMLGMEVPRNTHL